MKERMLSRTKNYSLEVWRLCNMIPKTREYDAFVRQLIRCSSSVGANYRAAQRAKSTADFINKLKIVEEEADESLYFLELLSDIQPDLKEEIAVLQREGDEILSIIVASLKTARKNQSKK